MHLKYLTNTYFTLNPTFPWIKKDLFPTQIFLVAAVRVEVSWISHKIVHCVQKEIPLRITYLINESIYCRLDWKLERIEEVYKYRRPLRPNYASIFFINGLTIIIGQLGLAKLTKKDRKKKERQFVNEIKIIVC